LLYFNDYFGNDFDLFKLLLELQNEQSNQKVSERQVCLLARLSQGHPNTLTLLKANDTAQLNQPKLIQ
jgi:hypothetical protein